VRSFVADSSVVVSWIIEDEFSPQVEALLDSLAQGAVVEAPVLLRYEVSNVLVTAYTRRKRISKEACATGLADFDSLPIRYDLESPRFASSKIAELAQNHLLSVYDATYLEMALRRSLPLATQDKELQSAARKLGVTLL
jgi:predicted nucleic acid-binding protein